MNQTAAIPYAEFFIKDLSLSRLLLAARTSRYQPQPDITRTQVPKNSGRMKVFEGRPVFTQVPHEPPILKGPDRGQKVALASCLSLNCINIFCDHLMRRV